MHFFYQEKDRFVLIQIWVWRLLHRTAMIAVSSEPDRIQRKLLYIWYYYNNNRNNYIIIWIRLFFTCWALAGDKLHNTTASPPAPAPQPLSPPPQHHHHQQQQQQQQQQR
jgi:hypothetical protein